MAPWRGHTVILASLRGNVVHLALLERGVLTEYTLWRPEAPDGVGDIHTGRIMTRAAALGGVFVDLDGVAGFLPDSAGGKAAHAGDLISVRVSRAPQGGKGPRLAATGQAPGPKSGLHQRGSGPVGDYLALQPDAALLADDFALVARLRTRFSQAEYRRDCFAAIADEVVALAEPEIVLPGGARATISPTPALTAIDVDAGGNTVERGEKSGAQARLNRTIIPQLARQIRLRNLGGAILIDFAGMKAAARQSLGPELAQALAHDPLKPRLLDFTALGFAEILRPRVRAPLHDLLTEEASWKP